MPTQPRTTALSITELNYRCKHIASENQRAYGWAYWITFGRCNWSDRWKEANF